MSDYVLSDYALYLLHDLVVAGFAGMVAGLVVVAAFRPGRQRAVQADVGKLERNVARGFGRGRRHGD